MKYSDIEQAKKIQVPGWELMDLIKLIAMDYAHEFTLNCADVPKNEIDYTKPEYPVVVKEYDNERQYKASMFGLCVQIKNIEHNKMGGILNSLISNFYITLMRSQYSLKQLQEATEQQWINFIKTGNPENSYGYEGMRKLFEHIAGTTKEGRVEYDAL